MKVKDLMNLLKDLPQDYEVILSKDGEGNDFSPLADHGLYMYVPDSTWSGEAVCKEECDEENYQENSVVLWPTN